MSQKRVSVVHYYILNNIPYFNITGYYLAEAGNELVWLLDCLNIVQNISLVTTSLTCMKTIFFYLGNTCIFKKGKKTTKDKSTEITEIASLK